MGPAPSSPLQRSPLRTFDLTCGLSSPADFRPPDTQHPPTPSLSIPLVRSRLTRVRIPLRAGRSACSRAA
eukprot:1243515-Prymnesium_polylepis.1